MRDHGFMAIEVAMRRISDGPRRLGSLFRRQRRYELRFPTGERRIVTLHQLDSLLNASAVPADFWAYVGAADAVFANGELDALVEWPTGRRVP